MKCLNINPKLHKLMKQCARQNGVLLSTAYNAAIEAYLRSPEASGMHARYNNSIETESPKSAIEMVEGWLQGDNPERFHYLAMKRFLQSKNCISPKTHDHVWDALVAKGYITSADVEHKDDFYVVNLRHVVK